MRIKPTTRFRLQRHRNRHGFAHISHIKLALKHPENAVKRNQIF
ncbi:hypothetical protein BN2475_170069 [Paraburkholderia ribeironis]|uniref:Uncharacterized protein n=1 Tax=Paraburkholderia ribeironis TaxID=1247936 RepID=A0A1N7RUN8_9BURK|nr:hypothetical protein BN2475_170069 [Paraburkholderia ribeironis]